MEGNVVGCYEAKTQFARLLRRVSQGERITITRHGKPLAILVPPDHQSAIDVSTAIERLFQLRKRQRATSEEIREWIAEGRRY